MKEASISLAYPSIDPRLLPPAPGKRATSKPGMENPFYVGGFADDIDPSSRDRKGKRSVVTDSVLPSTSPPPAASALKMKLLGEVTSSRSTLVSVIEEEVLEDFAQGGTDLGTGQRSSDGWEAMGKLSDPVFVTSSIRDARLRSRAVTLNSKANNNTWGKLERTMGDISKARSLPSLNDRQKVLIEEEVAKSMDRLNQKQNQNLKQPRPLEQGFEGASSATMFDSSATFPSVKLPDAAFQFPDDLDLSPARIDETDQAGAQLAPSSPDSFWSGGDAFAELDDDGTEFEGFTKDLQDWSAEIPPPSRAFTSRESAMAEGFGANILGAQEAKMIMRERRGGRRKFGDIGDQFPPRMHTNHSDSLVEVNERWEASFLEGLPVPEPANDLSAKHAKRVQFSEEIKVALIWKKESRNNCPSIILPVRPEDAVNNILHLDTRPRELQVDRSQFAPKGALMAPSEPVITEEEDDISPPSVAAAEEVTLTLSEAPATGPGGARSLKFSWLVGPTSIFAKAQQWLDRRKERRKIRKQKRKAARAVLPKEAQKAEKTERGNKRNQPDPKNTEVTSARKQERSAEEVQNKRPKDAAKKYVADQDEGFEDSVHGLAAQKNTPNFPL
ncbi:hypothetical protein BJ742DRAFT_305182 [Cladochytrium replicatum]|nr:hypothetical protein BJ742DRAFT_305182 [Cladochytrium replicatum]